MEIKDSGADDRWIAQRIIDLIPRESEDKIKILESESDSILDTIKHFGEQDLIFAYKTHSVVFSMIQTVPLIAIAYHDKTIDFMKNAQLQDYAIKDVDANSENLRFILKKVIENYDEIKRKERSYIDKANKQIMDFMQKID